MYMIEFRGNCRDLRDVFAGFTATFARELASWRRFERSLRNSCESPSKRRQHAAEVATRQLTLGVRNAEYRLPLVTIIFWSDQGIRFSPADKSGTLSVRALLLDSTALKAAAALVSQKVSFAASPRKLFGDDVSRWRAKGKFCSPDGSSVSNKDLAAAVNSTKKRRKGA